MSKEYYVYMISNKKDGILYIGFSGNLIKRVYEHKNKIISGFSTKYNLDKLVYYEIYEDPENAIKREKRLKKYRREDKIKLVEKLNPEWTDLYNIILSSPESQSDSRAISGIK